MCPTQPESRFARATITIRRCDALRAQGAMPCTGIAVSRAHHTLHLSVQSTRDYWLGQWDWNSVSGVYLSRISKVTRYRLTELDLHSRTRLRGLTYHNLREWHIESNRALAFMLALALALALAKAQSWARLSHILALGAVSISKYRNYEYGTRDCFPQISSSYWVNL